MPLVSSSRVLRPSGRALVWDFKPGFRLFHTPTLDPAERTHDSPLDVASVSPWRWPWPLTLAQRVEFARAEASVTREIRQASASGRRNSKRVAT